MADGRGRREKKGGKLLSIFKPSHSRCSLANGSKNQIFSQRLANWVLDSGLSLTLRVLDEITSPSPLRGSGGVEEVMELISEVSQNNALLFFF